MVGIELARAFESHDYGCDHRLAQIPAFRRPAAGRSASSSSVRSAAELQTAVAHLLDCVLRWPALALGQRYAYIADRLRQVRQEMTVQDMDDAVSIHPQVRFHAIARDLLTGDDAFDPVLNDALLADCIAHFGRDADDEYEILWRLAQGDLHVVDRGRHRRLVSAVNTANFVQAFAYVQALPYLDACLVLPLVQRCRRRYLARIRRAYRRPPPALLHELLRCGPDQIDNAGDEIRGRPRDPLLPNDDAETLLEAVLPSRVPTKNC